LNQYSECYEAFIKCKSVQDKEIAALKNLNLLGGGGLRQHLIILMAAAHLDDGDFDKLATAIEKLMFCYLIAGENPRKFERTFAGWAPELRSLGRSEEIDSFISDRIDKEVERVLPDLENALRNAGDRMNSRYQKYLLAKIEAYLRSIKDGRDVHEYDLDAEIYMNAKYEIDHIKPKAELSESDVEIESDQDKSIHLLGNLTLLEESHNKSVKHQDYDSKKDYFGKSMILMTRTMVDDLSAGKNGRFVKMSKKVRQFPIWNNQSIQDRQKMMFDLIA
ncbi:HNH endonuclease family protein, partial [bacterium]|nr:HNH endonuclease family protein [bacterium]